MKLSAYSDYVPNNKLSPQEIFKLINRSLATINPELQNHNEKTTFLALSVASYFEQTLNIPQLYYLSMFHSIGFYRYNPDFHSESIFDHKYHDNFIYGFYYLKYMTPLNDHARVIRCFDGGYEQLEPSDRVYAKIIFGAAHLAEKLKDKNLTPESLFSFFDEDNKSFVRVFTDDFIEAFKKANQKENLIQKILDDSYKVELNNYIEKLEISDSETLTMLKFLIYLMDFKSTCTVTHIINTACYATTLSRRMQQSQEELDMVFASALLHDIGKLAIPGEILESQKRFTDEERKIMQTHVEHSRKIIEDVVDKDICETACRHHEKMNGSGYPQHLTAENLSIPQRLLTVADINSALNDRRSYKDAWDKGQVFETFKGMLERGELDQQITEILLKDFDDIHKELPELQKIMYADFASILRDFHAEIYQNYMDELEEMTGTLTDEDYAEMLEEMTSEQDDELSDAEDLEEL